MTAVALGPKLFKELAFKAFENRKRSGYEKSEDIL